MTESSIVSLALIALAAVIAPILAELSGRLAIPEIVLQIGLGIVLGPYALNVAHPTNVVSGLSDLGLTFLIFLAGFDLDPAAIRGKPLALAVSGWVVSLVVALTLSFVLVSTGLVRDTVVVALALSTTALGSLLPILRDAGVFGTRFGDLVSAIGTVGEFGPIVAVAIFLTRRDPRITAALLVVFAAVAVVTAVIAARPNPPSLVNLFSRHLESSAQLPVRVSLLLVVLLVLLAETLGLDVLLGAFSAGIVMRLIASGSEPDVIKGKLEAIGFGFLIPVFFVVSGITFDLHVFLDDPASLWRVAFFVGLLLVSRGVPVLLLYRKEITRAERLPLVFFSATGLPLIVVITGIATAAGRIAPVNAASLVAAGMVSLMVFPAAGLKGLRRAGVGRSGGTADAGRSRAPATRRSSRRRSKGTT